MDYSNPKEPTMFRTFSTAAILALTVTGAQAETLTITAAPAETTLASRVHGAALAACSAESVSSFPDSHYGAITRACVRRLSNAAMARYQEQAQARTRASTAALINN